MSDEFMSELYWDGDLQRFLKFDSDKGYYTDEETRQADSMQQHYDKEENVKEDQKEETDNTTDLKKIEEQETPIDDKNSLKVVSEGSKCYSNAKEYEEMKEEMLEMENTISDLEMIVERSVLEKETAEQLAEELKQANSDLKLQLNYFKTEKKLVDTEVEELKVQIKKLQNDLEDKDRKLKNVDEYKEAFLSLKSWLIDAKQNLLIKEEENKKIKDDLQNSLSFIQQLKNESIMDRNLISEYEILLKSTKGFMNEQINLHQKLKESFSQKSNELSSYKQAWRELASLLRDREFHYQNELTDLKSKNFDLKQRLEKMELFIAPRSKRNLALTGHVTSLLDTSSSAERSLLKNISILNSSSNPSLILSNRLYRVDICILSKIKQMYESCIPKNALNNLNKSFNFVANIHRCYYKCIFILQYAMEFHFKDAIEQAHHNSHAISKDKGFIRWITVFSSQISKASYWLACYLYMLRLCEAEDLEKIIVQNTNQIQNIIENGEQILNKFVKYSQIDILSASVDLKDLETFVSDLSSSSLSFENLCEKCEEKVLKITSQSLLYKAYACIALCICGSTYVASASEVLSQEFLCSIIDKIYYTINWLLSEDLSDFFNLPLEEIVLESSESKIITTFKNELNIFEESIFSIEEKSTSDFATVLKPAIDKIEICINELHYAATHQTQKNRSDLSLTPFNKMCSEILKYLSNVAEFESKIAEISELCDKEKKIRQNLEEELKKTKCDVKRWESQFKEVRIKAELFVVLERDLNRLAKEKAEYVKLVHSYQSKLASAIEDRDIKVKEYGDVSSQLLETKQKLEAVKKMTRNSMQNDCHSKEIANLRSIIQKLDRENFYNEMKKAEKDPDFLQLPYIPAKKLMKHCKNPEQFGLDGNINDKISATEDFYLKQQDSQISESISSYYAEDKLFNITDSLKMIDDFRNLQEAALIHNFTIPLFNPNLDNNENDLMIKRYKNQHDAIYLQITALQKKIDKHLSLTFESARSFRVFDDHSSISTSRYIKQFTQLAGVDTNSKEPHMVGKINFSCVPDWMPTTYGDIQRLVLTEKQFAKLHKGIVG